MEGIGLRHALTDRTIKLSISPSEDMSFSLTGKGMVVWGCVRDGNGKPEVQWTRGRPDLERTARPDALGLKIGKPKPLWRDYPFAFPEKSKNQINLHAQIVESTHTC
ncbi:MAG: hypothetical protein K2Q22_15405 [Cytophagales bacterium]|nr:hypothetical protein [Cytophagales bacterium]